MARSVLYHAKVPTRWQKEIQARRPANVAAVALAHKMARTAWAILAHGQTYQKDYVSAKLRQPVKFTVGVPLELEDADGVIMQVTVRYFQAGVSLLEYVSACPLSTPPLYELPREQSSFAPRKSDAST
jgi:hypothetical protein